MPKRERPCYHTHPNAVVYRGDNRRIEIVQLEKSEGSYIRFLKHHDRDITEDGFTQTRTQIYRNRISDIDVSAVAVVGE